ncbi:MAG: hypothetical protein ACREAZ_01005 [Nitrososphaera sp.]
MDTTGSLRRLIDGIFRSYEDISYIAIVNEKLKVIAQKGFIELHPSKLHILHVQAALLVNMSSVWSESLGSLDYICASFDSKSEIIAMRLPNKMQLVSVLSSVHGKNLENIRRGIVKQFRSARITQ